MGPDGPLALITLLPQNIRVRAWQNAQSRRGCHAMGYGAMARNPLIRLENALGLPPCGLTLSHLPFPPGLGTGMSTASLVAHALLSGFSGSAQELACGTVAAEGASDPLMFDEPDRLLWASREGRVLSRGLPPYRAEVLGGFFGPALPTRAVDQNYDDVSDLVAAWRNSSSLTEQAALSSESARRCHHRRGVSGDPTQQLASDLGALGYASSHSGAARALIFAPGKVPEKAEDALKEAGLYRVLRFRTGARTA
ncbi:propanediol utilization protein [Thioclava sp. FR2]|uniref:propanediol utilization protein n=1 Tax=Thioclava sp. FR2 TaxID=3445780 RepID=UPI003EB988D6